MAELQVKNLSVRYEDKVVVKNCSFSLGNGEIVVVLGASGDGKTTLLKAISGLLAKEKGEVLFDNELVLGPDQQLVPGHDRIKLVNQDFDLDEYHTVEENIRLRLLSFDEAYRNERVKSLLRLTRLTRFKGKKALEISGGQRQRLTIARALADEPDLILLDEPFNQLDFQTKTTIASHVRRYLKKNKIGAIMVTHNGMEAMEWADRILFMKAGKIVRDDTPEAFFESPNTVEEARFFGTVNKIKIQDKLVHFRPSFFREIGDEFHQIQIDLIFKSKQTLGWHSAFYFSSGKSTVTLYSTKDISYLTSVYVRTIEIK